MKTKNKKIQVVELTGKDLNKILDYIAKNCDENNLDNGKLKRGIFKIILKSVDKDTRKFLKDLPEPVKSVIIEQVVKTIVKEFKKDDNDDFRSKIKKLVQNETKRFLSLERNKSFDTMPDIAKFHILLKLAIDMIDDIGDEDTALIIAQSFEELIIEMIDNLTDDIKQKNGITGIILSKGTKGIDDFLKLDLPDWIKVVVNNDGKKQKLNISTEVMIINE